MPEWLLDSFQKDVDISLAMLTVRLAMAFALGCVVAGVYRATHGKGPEQAAGLLATLVLLTVLICMVTLVIGNSVARAFSLVGALAIVRFRTVVEDTRDTAFVIFAVAVGMAVGAGFLVIPLVGIPFAALAAFLFRRRPGDLVAGTLDFALAVRVGAGHAPEGLLSDVMSKHVERSRLTTVATARQGAALDLTYQVHLRRADAAVALVAELNGLEGIQNVELRQP
jgi:uncharacterized membrane protein YhiD involved in acid resistance